MDMPNIPVPLFDTPAGAERALRSLNDAGSSRQPLSLVGQGGHPEEQAMGLCTSGDRLKAWGGGSAPRVPMGAHA
jgi:hypothetical protein